MTTKCGATSRSTEAPHDTEEQQERRLRGLLGTLSKQMVKGSRSGS
jgi:hypothetical protein